METPTTKTEAVETLLKLKEKLKHIGSPGDLQGVMRQIQTERMSATQEQQLEVGIDPNDAMLLDLRNDAIEKHLRSILRGGNKHTAENAGKPFTTAFGVSIKFTSSGTESNKLWNVSVTS